MHLQEGVYSHQLVMISQQYIWALLFILYIYLTAEVTFQIHIIVDCIITKCKQQINDDTLL